MSETWNRNVRVFESASIILIDIDHFKRYNDRFGHLAGDECLQKVARVIARHIQLPACAARFGGEEFACILPNTGLVTATAMAEQIRNRIMELRIEHEGSSVADCVTVSLGVVSGPCIPVNSFARIVRAADAQLYLAKANGRNLVESGYLSEV